jgi:hypothetical protein
VLVLALYAIAWLIAAAFITAAGVVIVIGALLLTAWRAIAAVIGEMTNDRHAYDEQRCRQLLPVSPVVRDRPRRRYPPRPQPGR